MLGYAIASLALFATAAYGSRRLTTVVCPSSSTAVDRWVFGATFFVAWCTLAAVAPGAVAEVTNAPAATPPVFAAVSLLGALAVGRWTPSRREEAGERQRRSIGLPRWTWGLAAPVIGLHALLLIIGLLSPPNSFDGTFYHIPTAVRWLQNGRLDIVPPVIHLSESFNGDLWMLFFTPFRNEPLLELVFIPFGLLLAAAAYLIAREIGGGRRGAIVIVLATLATPLVALHMYSGYVDLYGAPFVAIAVLAVLRLWRCDTREFAPYLLLVGLSAGLAIGTKHTFLVWGAPCLALAALAVGLRSGGQRPIRRVFLAISPFLGVIPGVGFWYFRAWLQTGWPLYPFKVTLGPVTLGVGMETASTWAKTIPHAGWASLAYPWFEWTRRPYPYSVETGLGAFVATFSLIGLLFLVLRRRRNAAYASGLWLTAMCLVGLALYLSVLQCQRRYALPLWILLIVASAPLLDLLLRRMRWPTVALLFACFSLSAVMTPVEEARSLASRIHDRDLSRSRAYEIPPLIENLPPGSVVLNCSLSSSNLPLMGPDWSNEVIWLESMAEAGLNAPLTAASLDQFDINIVYTRGCDPPPFASDVRYEVVYDDQADESRPQSTSPTRIYRILQAEG